MTFARAYTNIETREAYRRIFQEVVNTIEHDTGKILKFHHIDGNGLGCILADEHQGQALGIVIVKQSVAFKCFKTFLMNIFKFNNSGLGEFLHDRDMSKSAEEHLTHILKTCIIHFNRY